jgi:hypothetical protein
MRTRRKSTGCRPSPSRRASTPWTAASTRSESLPPAPAPQSYPYSSMFSNQSRAVLLLVRFELDSWGSDDNDNTSGTLDDEEGLPTPSSPLGPGEPGSGRLTPRFHIRTFSYAIQPSPTESPLIPMWFSVMSVIPPRLLPSVKFLSGMSVIYVQKM